MFGRDNKKQETVISLLSSIDCYEITNRYSTEPGFVSDGCHSRVYWFTGVALGRDLQGRGKRATQLRPCAGEGDFLSAAVTGFESS